MPASRVNSIEAPIEAVNDAYRGDESYRSLSIAFVLILIRGSSMPRSTFRRSHSKANDRVIVAIAMV
jgi:hypothetical protein